MTDGVFAALELLRRSRRKYVIVDAKHGLGNRLRALASAMSVAAALQRPVMLVWVSGYAPCCAHAAHLQTVTHMPWRATYCTLRILHPPQPLRFTLTFTPTRTQTR